MNGYRPICNLALWQAQDFGCMKTLKAAGEIVDTAPKYQ